MGALGVWSPQLRYGDPAQAVESVVELETSGYATVWLPDMGGPVFDDLERLLAPTSTLVVATGVLNMWLHDAQDVATWWSHLPHQHASRVLLGIGVSHAPFVGDSWRRPVEAISKYLDRLDDSGLPADKRCIAALGPRMLELSARRAAGSLTYLVPPEHTSQARAALGERHLYVGQAVVLETDPAAARRTARAALELYCGLPNYVNSWKRLGLTDEDVATRSDRLVDTIVAWGDRTAIQDRLQAHRDAGADHVCIQVLTDDGASPRPAWLTMAPARPDGPSGRPPGLPSGQQTER